MSALRAVTDDQVVHTLRDVVNERPDHVYVSPAGEYGGCLYVDPSDGCPSCLVGHVLYRLGADMTGVARAENAGPDDASERGGLRLSIRAEQLLATAQAQQDCGETWGTALQVAEDEDERRQVACAQRT